MVLDWLIDWEVLGPCEHPIGPPEGFSSNSEYTQYVERIEKEKRKLKRK